MMIKTDGIILSQRCYRDSEKFMTILTHELGLIEAHCKVFGQIKRTGFNSMGIFGFYRFDVFAGKHRYSVNTAEKIEDFYAIRYDVEKLALAGYFCELTQTLAPPKEHAWVYLRLLLNTLSFLEKGTRSMAFLKAVYELKALSIEGFMPNLVCCKECCEYNKPKMYFLPIRGELLCSDCMTEQFDQVRILVNKPVLRAMRYIIYKDIDELFNFSLEAEFLKQLGEVTEYYMLNKTEIEYNSLKMYKQLKTEE